MKRKPYVVALIFTVCLLCASFISANAATEECTEFSNVAAYNGIVYTTKRAEGDGGVYFADGNVAANSLPQALLEKEKSESRIIWSFCFYNDKIYYLISGDGTVEIPGEICSCNLDGTNNVVLADNAFNGGYACIVDNILYYDAMPENDENYPGYDGGIYKINLGDLSYQKFSVGEASLAYCDGDNIFYKKSNSGTTYPSFKYYKADINGNNVTSVSGDSDEFGYGVIIRGNNSYYVKNNALYVKTRNGYDAKKLADLPGYAHIRNVDDTYVYYTVVTSYTEMSTNAYLYRVSRSEDIKVIVNNTELSFDQPPVSINDRTMVPMRAIFEALGYSVTWDSYNQSALAVNGYDSILVKIDNNTIIYATNGIAGTYTCDVAPQMVSDRTLVPVRAIAECGGCTVTWDESTQTVYITK